MGGAVSITLVLGSRIRFQKGSWAHSIIVEILLLLSASPVTGRQSGFSISIWSYLLHSPPSLQLLPCPLSLITSINLLLGLLRFVFSGSSILSILLPIFQYTHHLSSVHVHTTSVLPLVFSLQTFPPVLSLWCTHSRSCPFVSLLMKIMKSSTFATSSPCILTVPLSRLSFTHMYSVFLLFTFVPLLSNASPASLPYMFLAHSIIVEHSVIYDYM